MPDAHTFDLPRRRSRSPSSPSSEPRAPRSFPHHHHHHHRRRRRACRRRPARCLRRASTGPQSPRRVWPRSSFDRARQRMARRRRQHGWVRACGRRTFSGGGWRLAVLVVGGARRRWRWWWWWWCGCCCRRLSSATSLAFSSLARAPFCPSCPPAPTTRRRRRRRRHRRPFHASWWTCRRLRGSWRSGRRFQTRREGC